MIIVLAGALGFLGRALRLNLATAGHTVRTLSSASGSIIPWSRAISRIQRSDLTPIAAPRHEVCAEYKRLG